MTGEHPALAVLPDAPTREQIDRLERELIAMEQTTGVVDLGLQHHHAGGIYGRQITIPAGTVLTGLEHKHAHLNVCAGDITVWTEQGMRRLTGVHVVASEPGAKRVGFAHADTVWVALHANPTGETDLDRLAEMFVERPDLLLENRHKPEEIAP